MDFSRLSDWLAQTGGATEAATEGAAQTPGFGSMLPLIAMIFIVFYFLILRPQKKEQAKRQEMNDGLGKGDAVVTIGGIHGTVESLDTEKGIVTLAVAPKVNMKFNKSAIGSIEHKKGEKKSDSKEK